MRLIDADALKTRKSINSANFNTIETIQEWIDNVPTIDAVPVVRCRDCKHRTYCYSEVHITNKRQTIDTHKDISYCSYGERRDDDHI